MAARPSQAATLRFLAEANEVAKEAVLEGNHPFGAVLVDPQAGGGEGEVLLRQGNIDTANHAESTLAREAFAKYPLDQLQRCTLYTTFEPCAVPAPTLRPAAPSWAEAQPAGGSELTVCARRQMCAGTIYWAGIGGLVYGAAEEKLRALTGNHPENPTLALPCRAVLDTGARPTTVVGPVPEMEAAVLAPHQQVRVSQPHSRRGVPAQPSARACGAVLESAPAIMTACTRVHPIDARLLLQRLRRGTTTVAGSAWFARARPAVEAEAANSRVALW